VKQIVSRAHVPPKRLLTFNGLNDVISEKAELFVTTAVRTQTPTVFIYVSKEIGLKIYAQKPKYMFISGHQNSGKALK
jgi:hypothetical protein